jgi:hypothetical protein
MRLGQLDLKPPTLSANRYPNRHSRHPTSRPKKYLDSHCCLNSENCPRLVCQECFAAISGSVGQRGAPLHGHTLKANRPTIA